MPFSLPRLLAASLLVCSSSIVYSQTSTPPPLPTVSNPPAYCQGSNAAPLRATPSAGGTLRWYGTTGAGGTASSAPPIPPTTLAGTTNYYVSQVVNDIESGRAVITVMVKPTPSAPATSPVTYAQYAPAGSLTATGQNLRWYTSETGGTGSTVSLTPSTTAVGTFTYYVSQTVQGCESARAALTVTVTATNTALADLALDMVISTRTPAVDEPVEFTTRVRNAGPQEATEVRVSSRLPPGMVFIDSSSPGVSFVGDSIRADIGTISIEESRTFRFRVRPDQPGRYILAAQITDSSAPDPDSQPNSGTEDGQDDAVQLDLRTPDASTAVFVSPNPNQTPLPPVQSSQPPADPTKADLSLSMTASTMTPGVNQPFSLSLTVSNGGGALASTVSVATLLPVGWQLTNSAGLSVNGQSVTGALPDIPAGGSATLVLWVRATGPGTMKAQIQTASPADPDSTPGNGYNDGEDDEASVSVRVL